MNNIKNKLALVFLAISLVLSSVACRLTDQAGKNKPDVIENLVSNSNGSGPALAFSFEKGEAYNHPTFVVWVEDTAGKYIQTLFITKSFGSGTFNYGDKKGGKWKPGQVLRPAALPYWSHKAGASMGLERYIPDSVHTVVDAYTGATPKGSFNLQTRGDKANLDKVKILFEINQTWDWNEYWTNSKFPDEAEYITSCQPALVYSATIDLKKRGEEVQLKPLGRSSHSGADGNLYSDLNTITTALHIAETITVVVK